MKAFYIALPHTEEQSLWEFLLSYTKAPEKLVLASEVSKKSHLDISGQHFHILAEWETKTYEAFKKTIIEKHYKLTGKAEKGGHRKYGIVRQIRDEEKMLSYTIKDGKFRSQNYSQEELDEAATNSYQKEDRKTNIELCLEHLKTMNKPHYPDLAKQETIQIYKFEEQVLEYWIENITDKVINKTTLHHVIVRFLTQEYPYYKKHIYEILQYIKKNT